MRQNREFITIMRNGVKNSVFFLAAGDGRDLVKDDLEEKIYRAGSYRREKQKIRKVI